MSTRSVEYSLSAKKIKTMIPGYKWDTFKKVQLSREFAKKLC